MEVFGGWSRGENGPSWVLKWVCNWGSNRGRDECVWKTQEKTGEAIQFTETTKSRTISDKSLSGYQIKLNSYGK